MQYMLLIYSDPNVEETAEMQEWFDYTNELQEAGVLVAGEPLDAVENAVTVRIRDGETLTTKGPFAETTEVLGGFYIVDVDTMEEAEKWAAKLPSTRYGSTEVRVIPPMPSPE